MSREKYKKPLIYFFCFLYFSICWGRVVWTTIFRQVLWDLSCHHGDAGKQFLEFLLMDGKGRFIAKIAFEIMSGSYHRVFPRERSPEWYSIFGLSE